MQTSGPLFTELDLGFQSQLTDGIQGGFLHYWMPRPTLKEQWKRGFENQGTLATLHRSTQAMQAKCEAQLV